MSGSFTVMQNSAGFVGQMGGMAGGQHGGPGGGGGGYAGGYSVDKLPPMALSPPPQQHGHYGQHHSVVVAGLHQTSPLSPSYGTAGHQQNNGLHSPSKSLDSPTGYDYTIRGGGGGGSSNGCLGPAQHSPGGPLSPQSHSSLHSPPHAGYSVLSQVAMNGLAGPGGPLSPPPQQLSPQQHGHQSQQHGGQQQMSPTPPPGLSLMERMERMERMRDAMPQSPSPPLGVSLSRDAMISSMGGGTIHLASSSQIHLAGHSQQQQQQQFGPGSVGATASKHSPPSSISTSSPSNGGGGGGGGGGVGGGGGGGGGSNNSSNNGAELEEINTKELAARISAELKRYSIPQAIFAQRVLCRSQGTLSDLLRNPKPWSKLKSGRETFRRMWKWLQEPEFQRMSALRLAGKFLLLSYYFIFSFIIIIYMSSS